MRQRGAVAVEICTMLWIDAEPAELTRSFVNSEGNVVYPSVVIARSSPPPQLYHASELLGTDIEPDERGWIAVERPAGEVFEPRSIHSFAGIPLTMGHVDVGEAEDKAVGRVWRPRREGATLVADLEVSDAKAIRLIRDAGWRSISAGYECGYRPLGTGRAAQFNIAADHVAVLSPDQMARCGDLCAIRDAATFTSASRDRRPTMTRDDADWYADIDFPRERFSKFTKPAARRSRDQGMQSVLGSTQMGRAPNPQATGPVIVARVPYAATNCTIGTDGSSPDAVVWYHSRIAGELNPGTTHDAMRRAVNDRVAREQQCNAEWARDMAARFREQSRRA
jgi:hypothetical protein